jgi:riboflavin synthase
VFSGLIVHEGRVASIEGDARRGMTLVVEAPDAVADGVAAGDSVAINGVCLTVTERNGTSLSFDAVPETLSRTALGRLAAGSAVNLEPALRAGEPLGGHYVQGHVDGVGRVRSIEPEGDGVRLAVETPVELLRYCVEKGSITVEGVSLTIAALRDHGFEVALIPHTLAETTLATLVPGDPVNLEADVLAKYVERLIAR